MERETSIFKRLLVALAIGLPVALIPVHKALSTVSNQASETISALGDGSTVNFTIGFTFQSTGDVHVYLQDESATPYSRTEVLQGAGSTKFTITGTSPGTTIHMGTAPTSSQRLIIKREMAYTQTVGYSQTQAFPAKNHEAAMDKMTLLLQQLQTAVDQKVGLTAVTTSTTPTFPEPYADRFVLYNHAGDDLTLAPTEASSLSSGQVLKYGTSSWDLFDLDGALSTLTTGVASKVDQTVYDAHVASNSAHGATSSNTASRIVSRDASGNFSAGTITAALTGNASSATTATTATTAVNVSGTVGISNGGTGQTSAAAAFDALAPGTTKGDLISRSGSSNVRVAVGPDGSVLTADSTKTAGINWVTSPPVTTADDSLFQVQDHTDTSLFVSFDAAGTTGTSTTIQSSQTANRVITLPNATDTLVGKATTDTLTNKTISGGSNTLSNIPNSATTATAVKTNSAIVARDGSGAAALDVTGNLTGNVTGAVTGAASLNVLKAGDTMTGPLVMPSGIPSATAINAGTAGDGITFPSTTTIAFNSGGAEVSRFSGNGQLINTTTADTTHAIHAKAPAAQTGILSMESTGGTIYDWGLSGNSLTLNLPASSWTPFNAVGSTQSVGLSTTNSSPQYPIEFNTNSANTTVGSITNGSTDYGMVAFRNKNATLNNQTGLVLAGSSLKPGSEIISTNQNQTSGQETTKLDLRTANAGTLSTGLTVNAAGTITLPQYTSGVLKTDASGNVTAGSAGGLKNYIVTNADIENNATTGFSLGTATLTNGIPSGVPTFGSGASANLSIAATATTPIAGTYSLNYVSSAATVAGDFVATSAFTVDPEGQSKPLQFKISYQYISGTLTSGAFSGTSSNYFGVALYDVTNSAWIPCSGNFNVAQSSGVGLASGVCQTNSTTASARLAFYNVSASSGAITMKLDSWFLGPQVSSSGAAVTDWVTYTPTFGGLTASGSGVRSRRVGDSLEVQGYLTVSSVSASTALITLGYNGVNGNVSVDYTKVNAGTLIGFASNNNGASVPNGPFSYGIATDNGSATGSVNITWETNAAGLLAPQNGSAAFSAQVYSFFFKVPIVGWSSNTAQSADSDQRVVSLAYGLTTLQAVGANGVVKYDTLVKDTHSAYNPSTGLYTAPVTGQYRISAQAGSSVTGNVYVKINGTGKSYLFVISATNSVSSGSLSYPLNAGDTVGIYFDTAGNANGSTTQGFVNYLSIERISGSPVIQATESVYMVATGNAPTGTLNGSANDVIFGTKVSDSHSNYNATTGVYTIQAPGFYRFDAQIQESATYVAGNDIHVILNKNGSALYDKLFRMAGSTNAETVDLHGGVYCLPGDTLKIQSSNGGTTPTFSGTGVNNYFMVSRSGS